MEEKRKSSSDMDLKQVQEMTRENNDEGYSNHDDDGNGHHTDSGYALQSFLDHIPISSIPSINPNPSVELKPDDYVRDAVSLLYNKNVRGAVIVDNVDSDFVKLVDQDIGFIEFYGMVLWSLEEFNKIRADSKCNSSGFLSTLEQYPHIGKTKIGELAKSFLWEPFFPVNSKDSLFHVLLLFSKHHRLKVVPVKSSIPSVIGFITQNAVLQLLLRSSGLNWFDQIADKAIKEFRFEKAGRVFSVHGDQTLSDALHILWEEQSDGVPVVDQRKKIPIGIVRSSDIYLLLEDNNLFDNRKTLKLEEFINMYSGRDDQKCNTEGSTKAETCCGALLLKDKCTPQMNTLVTNRNSDSLKHVMENLAASNSTQSFLVDESGKLEGLITIRDIISEFSPPMMDSRIDGGGFFSSALEQAGCYVKDGSMIHKH